MVDSGQRNTVARRPDLRGMVRRVGRHDATGGLVALHLSLAPFGSEVIAWIISRPFLPGLVDMPTGFLGGMWAVIATVFVFRDTRAHSVSAGIGICDLAARRF